MTMTEPFIHWSLETVTKVKSCWAETLIDDSLLAVKDASDGITDAIYYSFEAIVKTMVFQAHLDKMDCLFTTNKTEDIGMTKIHIAWRPSTLQADFFEGPADGMVTSIPRLFDPYKVCIQNASYTKDEGRGDLDIPEIVYHYDGWNPNSRHWIYRARY